jgi:hypothetical protein
VSAQELQQQDDEQPGRRQDPGAHSDPNRPPRPDEQPEDSQPEDPGVARSRDEDEHGRTREERAQKRKDGTLEDGSAFPTSG